MLNTEDKNCLMPQKRCSCQNFFKKMGDPSEDLPCYQTR